MEYNITLDPYLKLARCPHCSIDKPNLKAVISELTTKTDINQHPRGWLMYSCSRCGGVVVACYDQRTNNRRVTEVYPSISLVNDVLPNKVKHYLQQAVDSAFAPSGSIMLCASSVDAMLKEKGYKTGSLYTRIDKAKDDGLITSDMATWAHQVRLDANDERHADEESEMPSVEEAKQAIEFTTTLAELLFVLPAKVSRGIDASATKTSGS